MASRRNNQGAGILIAIGLIVAAVAFLGPFAVALWVLIKEAKAFRYGGARKAADIISVGERDALGRAEAEIAALRTDAAEIQYRGDQLGLQRRLEGSRFDARNRQSRDLNDQLDRIEGEIASLSLRLGNYQAQLSSRLEAWLQAITGRAAARVALLAFMTAFAVVMLRQIETLGGSASLSRLLFGAPGDGPARAAASLLATLIALVAGWIAGAIRRASLAA